jgi:chorismate dehydratase
MGASIPALRLGAVSYINTVPLLCELPEVLPGHDQRLECLLATPAELCRMLREGALDVALISSAEFLEGNYRQISSAGIGASREVLSVRLFSRVPAEQVKRVIRDPHSRASNSLMRVLIERFGVLPGPVELMDAAGAMGRRRPRVWHDAEALLEEHEADALLLIGDSALQMLGGAPVEVDLAEAWISATGHPFTFAVWAARPELPADVATAMGAVLQHSMEEGLRQLPSIAMRLGREVARGLSPTLVEEYLLHRIDFALTAEHRAGMKLFGELLRGEGDAPAEHHAGRRNEAGLLPVSRVCD